MRAHKLSSIEFPTLGWQDIPALLRLGHSKRILTCFPINPLSSEMVSQCTEGIVALWLLEGIRKGGNRFPSLNALVGPFENGDDYEAASESHHMKALKSYQNWWNRVKSLPRAQAETIEPVEAFCQSGSSVRNALHGNQQAIHFNLAHSADWNFRFLDRSICIVGDGRRHLG
jgi:hypothetical protein